MNNEDIKFKQLDNDLFECPICKKHFNKHGIKGHYFLQHTEEGQQHKQSNNYGFKGKTGWNKGLTKENNKSILKGSETAKKRYASGEIINHWKGKHHKEEIKQKISEKLKGNNNRYKENGGGNCIKGWYKGYWCDSLWELAYIIYCLDHKIHIERNLKGFEYEYKGKKHLYFPDFIVNEEYVEIKGLKSELTEVKIKSVPNIRVFYKEDLKHVFDYIKEKYNKTYNSLQDLYDEINNDKRYEYVCASCGKAFRRNQPIKPELLPACGNACRGILKRGQKVGGKWMFNKITKEKTVVMTIEEQEKMLQTGWKYGMK